MLIADFKIFPNNYFSVNATVMSTGVIAKL